MKTCYSVEEKRYMRKFLCDDDYELPHLHYTLFDNIELAQRYLNSIFQQYQFHPSRDEETKTYTMYIDNKRYKLEFKIEIAQVWEVQDVQ